ncbi:hypothetical protein OHS16_28840 [Streptomyces sp. NBC_00344]
MSDDFTCVEAHACPMVTCGRPGRLPVPDRQGQGGRPVPHRPLPPGAPTGQDDQRKGRAPSVASICRALAEHKKREAYPEDVARAHADFADLQDVDEFPQPRPARILTPYAET